MRALIMTFRPLAKYIHDVADPEILNMQFFRMCQDVLLIWLFFLILCKYYFNTQKM